MEDARCEAISDVARAMLRAAGAELSRHGDDPLGREILTAAVTMLIKDIDRALIPGFRKAMAGMLEPK